MSQKTHAVITCTIGIDTGKNTLHLVGLDDRGCVPSPYCSSLGCWWALAASPMASVMQIELPAAPVAEDHHWARTAQSSPCAWASCGRSLKEVVQAIRDRTDPFYREAAVEPSFSIAGTGGLAKSHFTALLEPATSAGLG
jgi:hypothetical protein